MTNFIFKLKNKLFAYKNYILYNLVSITNISINFQYVRLGSQIYYSK